MGVPGFFAWLLKKHKKSNIITSNIDNKEVDILYLDTNCLIHPQCFKVLGFYNDSIDIDKLERQMFKRILNYVDYLIAYVNPKKEVYISIDGIAPAAKMNQQRKRRFKAMEDNEMFGEIKKKYGKEVATIWTNTTITPGTVFMEKLHQEFLKYIKANRTELKIKYTYSSYHTMGEGEHKILQDIKDNMKNPELVNDTYCIYGLDADLIFLSLASEKNNIYLLREEMYLKRGSGDKPEIIDIVTDVGEDLNYVSIDETNKSINEQLRHIINGKDNQSINNQDIINSIDEDIDFTNDFIVMCYFLGNDFLPNIPSIEIKNRGIDFLLDNYTEVYLTLNCGITYKNSSGKVVINNIFLAMLFKNLAKYEDYYFKVKYPRWVEYRQKRRCPCSDPYDKEIWNIDNMKTFKPVDPIKLGHGKQELWKFRYYEHYYGVIQYQQQHINDMCKEYVDGVIWNMLYYFESCPSWNWFYKYYHSPFVSDLSNYLKNNANIINDIKFDNSKTITPFIQLLSVLPPTCYYLLPPNYSKLMTSIDSPLIDMYPIKVETDMLYKDSFHKCIPMLPNMNIDRIINAVNNIKLTSKEKERNSIKKNFTITH
jgi:5'-3' exonuclease